MPVHALRPLGEVNAERHQGEREALINALGQDGARRQDGAPRRLEDQLPALPFVPGCPSNRDPNPNTRTRTPTRTRTLNRTLAMMALTRT